MENPASHAWRARQSTTSCTWEDDWQRTCTCARLFLSTIAFNLLYTPLYILNIFNLQSSLYCSVLLLHNLPSQNSEVGHLLVVHAQKSRHRVPLRPRREHALPLVLRKVGSAHGRAALGAHLSVAAASGHRPCALACTTLGKLLSI